MSDKNYLTMSKQMSSGLFKILPNKLLVYKLDVSINRIWYYITYKV